MANSPKRKVNYKPRFSEEQALELLPIEIKAALWDGLQSWSAAWALREYRKALKTENHTRACSRVINRIEYGDLTVAAHGKDRLRPWVDTKVRPLRSHTHLYVKATT